MPRRNDGKRKKGSAITEFGPALFLFVVIIFFPLLDVIGISCVYCCGWYCNFLVTRELAVRKQADGLNGTVANEVNAQFIQTGIAKFIGISGANDLVHTANYPGGNPPIVECTSNVTGQPFITIPFIPAVPGLSAPVTFTMGSQRPREVTN